MKKIALVLAAFAFIACGCEKSYGGEVDYKERFIRFMNDEIPVSNHPERGEMVYFSQIDDFGGIASWDEEIQARKRFYIMDMNRDGIPDICYENRISFDILVYNDETECFDLWFTDVAKYSPLRTGELTGHWHYTWVGDTHLILDENGGQASEVRFISEPHLNTETGEEYSDFFIDDKEVSEEEWHAESAYLYELRETAPEAMSYAELAE